MNRTTRTACPGEENFESLSAIMRSLRLAGMAEDLPGLLEEAAREEWGNIEILHELFHREGVRKRGRRFEGNLKASGLSESCSSSLSAVAGLKRVERVLRC